MKVTIGVDVSGADVDQRALFEACLTAATRTSISLICYHSSSSVFFSKSSSSSDTSKPGDSTSAKEAQGASQELSRSRETGASSSIECQYCPDVISMKDEALVAIRLKKNSSLVRAMNDLKSGRISALVTCANTGAVTAAAVVYLKRFSRLHHPALIAVLPLPKGPVVALDMGAFVTATHKDLCSYAFLGSAYATVCQHLQRPRIGLLNIAREQGRGTHELQQADHMLSHTPAPWQYIGNVEPEDIFSGRVDVLVTAGFAGNIFLKTAEAMMALTGVSIANPGRGALLAGVQGVVIKCHGSSSASALITAIGQAQEAVEQSTVTALERAFTTLTPCPIMNTPD
jgi:glycerol-3-phosphate acyltransferase PlsX